MIIKTFKEFLDLKKMIQPFCVYIAHIDVWSGVGKWLEEGINTTDNGVKTRNLCSFITESKTPLVKGKSVWNICCDKPVYNDVTLRL